MSLSGEEKILNSYVIRATMVSITVSITYFYEYNTFFLPMPSTENVLVPCEFLNVTNEMQLLKTLLLSLLYMFRALLARHQQLTKTVRAAYSDGML